MAEGVLVNIASSALDTLRSLAVQEIGQLWGFNDELEKLLATVATIKAVLLDAEKLSRTSNQVKLWLGDLEDAVYDVDDLLGDISNEAFILRRVSSNVVTKKVRQLQSSRKMGGRVRDARAKLDEIVRTKKFHLNDNLVEPDVVMSPDRDTHSFAPSVFIGRDGARREIMSLLLADHEENVAVVPIVGLGGMGKTTLAQIIYNDGEVETKFELKVWVCVSEVFDVKLIVEKMIECIDGRRPEENLGMETLRTQLAEKINGRKYLLVLDDIWNEDREKWVQLSDLIIGGARGSRIILTTRSKRVAEITGTLQPYELDGLSKIESWYLFQTVAFKQRHPPNEEFEILGKEIAKQCGGLPLAIRTIGSLLYTKQKKSEWQYFKDGEFSKLDPKIDILKTLKLSYNHLPSNLKHCFAYCCLFPKDHSFDVSTLINYWKAQGYIDARNEGTSYEDQGLICLEYLVQRSFFQVEKENRYGEIVKCKMHDFMHDLAILVAGEGIKLVDGSKPVHESSSGTNITRRTRHVFLNKVQWQLVPSLLQRKNVRTLIVEDELRGLHDQLWHAIIDKLRYLRVLRLHRCGIMALPSFIDCLMHLRQLDLSWNLELEMLPDSVTRLRNLHVLNLDYCRQLKELPKDMKDLVNLTHLGLENCKALEDMPQEIGQLTSLEVLPRFSLSKKGRRATGRLDELNGLNKLRGKLEILNLLVVEKGAWECEAANLRNKPHIEVLVLCWKANCDEVDTYSLRDVRNEEKSLEALEPHKNLRELVVSLYEGTMLPKWVSTLENLVRIEIMHSGNLKSLPLLDRLSSLQHLEVVGSKELEYMIDNNGDTNRAGMPSFFPSLKTVILRDLPKLKGWWRSTPATDELIHYQLSCLSRLEIHDCPNLKGRMSLLPSLNTLGLHYINAELLEEALKQAKPPSTSTSTRTTVCPLRCLVVGVIEDLGVLQEEALQSLVSLTFLIIHGVRDTRFLSPWLQHLTSLVRLTISHSEETNLNLFEEKNIHMIQCLGNLRSLEFHFCRKMESLPASMGNLTSLNKLEIFACDNLSKRCGSNQGEDWPSISHIPNIMVEHKWVQRDGLPIVGGIGSDNQEEFYSASADF